MFNQRQLRIITAVVVAALVIGSGATLISILLSR